MTLTAEIRALLKAHGPLTAPQIRALLPARRGKDGQLRLPQPRQIHSSLHASCQPLRDCSLPALMQRLPGDRYQWLRDPAPVMTPEEAKQAARAVRRRYEDKRTEQRRAERLAAGVVPRRALTIKKPGTRQCLSGHGFGVEPDKSADERPCTETWLAANADKYERLPTSGPRAVSPAARLRYTYG